MRLIFSAAIFVQLLDLSLANPAAAPRVTLNATYQVGKVSDAGKIKIEHPKLLLDLGENEDMLNNDEEEFEDGRRLVSTTIYIYGYPLWGSDVIFEEDEDDELPWSITGDYEDDAEDLEELVSTIIDQAERMHQNASVVACQDATLLRPGPGVSLNWEVGRNVYYDDETDTVTFVDEVALWDEEDEQTVFYCLYDILNDTMLYAVNDLQSAAFGGNSRIGKRQIRLDTQRDEATGRCLLLNPSGSIHVWDNNFSESESEAEIVDFDCNQGPRREINGGYDVAADCFDYAVKTQECLAKHVDFSDMGSIGPNGNLDVHIHFGQNIENAFWNGNGVFFGDGADNEFPSCTSMDGVAHEIGHGITDKFSKLIYAKESGCMNEAFSDMTAMMVRVCVRGSTDWYFDLDAKKDGRAHEREELRNIKKPVSDSQQIKRYADYDHDVGVHVCSGIYNHVFYKLSTMANWDIFKAYRIFFGANRMYWQPASTMAEGACGVVQYAQVVGMSAQEIKQIDEVFKSVGVIIKNCSALATSQTPVRVTPKPPASAPAPTLPTTRTTPRTTTTRTTTTTRRTTTTTTEPDQFVDDSGDEYYEIYELENCRTESGLWGDKGDTDYFYITVQANRRRRPTKLVFTLRTTEGDDRSNADMFIKYGEEPIDEHDYDIGHHVEGSIITATVTCPPPGDYYVIIHGYDEYENLDLNACFIAETDSECDHQAGYKKK